ncbi:hypothetical protein BCR44DRAFT_62184 [Catenaria anguillulae PL171]|uniref:Uncharacterized protein n=1 Tax=Catenaria anguillulae PL171 TaxID=765915 RepID=A0A1Y2HBQ3_9FUNG|nr:hypothetical protein BCR44DRAFT_62184 [Catenaria anguillulae PL171]
MLLKIPKKTATTLLTQAEEDLETFREVTELDGTDEHQTLHSRSGTSLFAWLSSGNKRAFKVKMLIASIAFAIGCLVCMMLGAPLMSTGLKGHIDWLVTSGNRRYEMQSWLVFSQEAFFADGSIASSRMLKSLRGNVRDIGLEHEKLETISATIYLLFPNSTIYPRNCTLAASCPAASDIPDVGFTRALATMSLEAEADLLTSVVNINCDHLALQFSSQGPATSTSPVDTSTRAYKTWLYGRAVAQDVIQRVQEVNALTLAQVHREVANLISMCVGMFVLTLAVFGAVGYVFYKVAVKRMLNRTEAIIGLMFLIGSEHMRDVPEVGKLIETGGLMLFMKSDDEEATSK